MAPQTELLSNITNDVSAVDKSLDPEAIESEESYLEKDVDREISLYTGEPEKEKKDKKTKSSFVRKKEKKDEVEE